MMNLVIEPNKRKGEGKEDRIDQHRNKGKLIDFSSEKVKGKAPMIWTDPSADKVFDKKPHEKAVKSLFKSLTVGSCSGSNNGESHKSRGHGHVVSVPVTVMGSLGYVETTWCAERASWNDGEEPEVLGLLEIGDSLPKTKCGFKWANIEEMLLFLKDSPQVQMEAICALYRHGRKTHELATIRLSYSYYENISDSWQCPWSLRKDIGRVRRDI